MLGATTPVVGAQSATRDARGGAATVRLFRFRPDTLRVRAGAPATWVNRDAIAHTVTSGTPGAPDGRFAAPLDSAGARARLRIARPGTYPYFCERHAFMRGVLVVTPTAHQP